MSLHHVRPARTDELPLLPALDSSGADQFRRAGMHLVADMPSPAPEAYAEDQAAGRVLVVCDEDDAPVGFVQLAVVDDDAHVAQLSVHPAHAGRRLGALLLDAAEGWARAHGHARMTLTTYRSVPWNAPYYARLGWEVLPDQELGERLTAVRSREHALGLDAWPRVAMVKVLARPAGRPVLRTARIELRPLTPEHLPLLRDLDADPEVMRHVLGRPRTAQEAQEFWAPRCADTTADALGLGWWVGFRGEDFLGWWDLGRSDSDPWATVDPEVAEIGWRLERRHWGQGLATEGARALLAHGFGTVGLERVVATTMSVNAASLAVMAKIGMTRVPVEHQAWESTLEGAEHGEVTYAITAAAWRRAQDG